MIVHASEDIGLADPRALLVAVAARARGRARRVARGAVEPRRGGDLPRRAHRNRTACTPRSPRRWRTRRRADPVPQHLRDASYPGAKQLGHGKGYRYPHDFPGHEVEQAVPAGEVRGRRTTSRRARARTRSPGRHPDRRTTGEPATAGAAAGRVCYGASATDDQGRTIMALLAVSGGDTALIILAAFWGLLVLFLCVVLLNTFRVLESTKMMIDTTREETVPLLREVGGRWSGRTVRSTGIGRRHPRARGELSRLVEQAASSPLVKIISVGAGLRKGVHEARRRARAAHACSDEGSGSRSGSAPAPRARCWHPAGPRSRPPAWHPPRSPARPRADCSTSRSSCRSRSRKDGRRWRTASASSGATLAGTSAEDEPPAA